MICQHCSAPGRIIGLLVVAACMWPSLPASADIYSAIANTDTYYYEISHVPDFDQRRYLLPNSGREYCVPTASINWMAYFANHGRPTLAPGSGYWQGQALYADATSAIETMGLLMSTDPYDGTDGNGSVAGLMIWSMMGHYFVSSHYLTDFWSSPVFQDISLHVFSGAYVIPVVGWYKELSPGIIKRDGGHALSLTYGARSGDDKVIGWRDPARDEGSGDPLRLLFQSAFATETYAVEDRMVMPGGGMLPRFMGKVVGYGSAYLDEYIALYPQFVLTSSPDPLLIDVHYAFLLYGAANSQHLAFPVEIGTDLVALVIHPDLGSHLYITDDPSSADPPQIRRLRPATGESELIDIPLVEPTDLLVGRKRELYVLDGPDLVSINIDIDMPDEMRRITPPSPIAAMAYDDDTDELVLLSLENRELVRYAHHLDEDPTVQPIPAEVPLGERGAVAWDRAHGAAWVVSNGSDSLLQLTANPLSGELEATEVSHPNLVAPVAVDVNDAGRVFVSSQGKVLEFQEDATRSWQLASDPLFPDVEAGAFLQVARSHTNYDPEVHGGPEWRDVPPEQLGEAVRDCPADFDHSGSVDLYDLFVLFYSWGECPGDRFCHADLDYSGSVGFWDYYVLLWYWGPCDG